jgi:hypothetical protein
MIEEGLYFIQIKGGWINPEDIIWVQTAKYNELMFLVALHNLDKPIHLNEQDSATLRKYLEAHTWVPEEEEDQGLFDKQQGELEDAV